MLKSLTFGGSLILIASTGFAQQTMQAQPLPGTVKDAGVFNLATGTWTRASQQNPMGDNPKRIYVNTAPSGFFGVMGVAADIVWTDEGRIPSTSGHANAKADSFLVKGFQIAYCSSVNGPQNGGIAFYELYTSCTDPLSLTPAAAFTFSVPGGNASGTRCWSVGFDVTGTSLEFKLAGDGDGTFDGSTSLDNFGWTLALADQGTGGFNGPILCGDPNNVPYGDGTYYQNSSATYGTGLGTVDQFWLNDATATYANGCYWFGGYAAGNPYSSFWLAIIGCNQSDDTTKYCTANNNSTGAPADITMKQKGQALDLTNFPYIFSSNPVPNQPGIFFSGNNQAQVPFGCSFLCATGAIDRGGVTNGVANRAEWTYDGSSPQKSFPAHYVPGFTANFQYWYRDPMNAANCAGGATFNTSNGLQKNLN